VRRRALLALSLPLAAGGCLAGHALAYTLVGASREDARAHGYLAFAPQFVAVSVTLVALALGLRVSGRLRGRLSAWPFAVLAPLAFSAQELIERLAAGLPAHAVLEPVVWVGLAAQLPIALVAFLAARALLHVADEAALALVARRTFRLRPELQPAPAAGPAPAETRLAFDRLGRAPPR
jgi:hypothetical protein